MLQTISVINPLFISKKPIPSSIKNASSRFGAFRKKGPRIPIIPYSVIHQGPEQEKRERQLKRLFSRLEKDIDAGKILIVGDRTQYPKIIQAKIQIHGSLYTVSKWMLPLALKKSKGMDYGYLLEKVSPDPDKTPEIQLYLGQSAQHGIQMECRYKQRHLLMRVIQDFPTDSPLVLGRANRFFQRLEDRGLFDPDYDELLLD